MVFLHLRRNVVSGAEGVLTKSLPGSKTIRYFAPSSLALLSAMGCPALLACEGQEALERFLHERTYLRPARGPGAL